MSYFDSGDETPVQQPGYWIDETSGVLKPVVLAYLNGQQLKPPEVATMRAYLRQWLELGDWRGGEEMHELRRRIDVMITTQDVHEWIRLATDLGMDPL